MGPPLVIFGPQYCLPHPIIWTVREGFTEKRGETEFIDSQGTVDLKLAASLKWFTSKQAIVSPSGRPIGCSFWDPVASSKAYLCPGNRYDKSCQVACIQQRMLSTQAHMDVFLRGNKSNHPDIEIKGSFWKRSFSVQTASKQSLFEIAHVQVPSDNFFSDTSSAYRVSIEPEVDIAFTALVLCYIDDTIRCIMYSLAAGGAAGSSPF